jgi:hypothetical protein
MAGSLIGLPAAHTETIKQRPCDIYAAGNTPCVAAHSTVRSLYAKYTGALYQVKRASDDAAQNIGLLADGYANAAAQDSFCAKTTCIITRIYDQSPRHNDLAISSGGHFKGPGPDGSDLGAAADALPITAGGHQVYGVSISAGMGYRNNRTSGVAVKGEPEGMYMVSSGTHFNSGCCFDYGNAETSGNDTGAGHMDAINVSRDLEWPDCRDRAEVGVGADLENGIFHWDKRSCNPAANFSGGPRPFISAWLKNNGQTRFALKWGDARAGGLNTIYSGALPNGYTPMRLEGAIILGMGGDNSHASIGSFFEGVIHDGRFSHRQRRQRHPGQRCRGRLWRAHWPLWNIGAGIGNLAASNHAMLHRRLCPQPERRRGHRADHIWQRRAGQERLDLDRPPGPRRRLMHLL